MAGETIFFVTKKQLLTTELINAVELEGYVVKTMDNFNALVTLGEQIMPHLIVFEVNDALNDIQKYKEKKDTLYCLQDIPCLAVMNSVDRNEAVLLARMGVFDILVSPLSKEKLIATVQKAASRMKKDGEFRLVDEPSEDGFTIIEFLTQLDASNSRNVENFVDHLIIDRDVKKVQFDFKQVRYVDSSGIGVLIVCKKKLEMLGGELKLTNVNEQVKSLLQTLHIDVILGLKEEVKV